MITNIIKKTITGIILITSTAIHGSPLKSDETVVFFPTAAHLNKDSQWKVPIHLWVFEKEDKSLLQKLTQKGLSEIAESLDIPEEQADSELFRQRMMWFLVDNERRKELAIKLDIKTDETSDNKIILKTLNLSTANGHSQSTISIPSDLATRKWIKYQVETDIKKGSFVGQSQLIPKTGLSVISDIDDTIKISEVLDKKALMRNTFTEEYKTTPNMPEYYKELAKKGAYFHYVSASPWQIFPSLKPFMDENYPLGSYSLRNFRLKVSSILKFLEPSKEYKLKQIRNIIGKYPEHQFILIGDSGEHDPEVYARIYAEFPNQIKSIKIRAVPESDLSEARFEKTFAGLPKGVWRILYDDKSANEKKN